MLLTLLAGIVVLIGCMFTYILANAFMVHLLVGLIRRGFMGPHFWRNVAVIMMLTLLTIGAQLIQISLWGIFFQAAGEFDTFEKSFYFSAENFTSLGYGDIVLTDRLRILGPLEAINGLLVFGLSTALLFAVISRVIANRLRSQDLAASDFLH